MLEAEITIRAAKERADFFMVISPGAMALVGGYCTRPRFDIKNISCPDTKITKTGKSKYREPEMKLALTPESTHKCYRLPSH